MLSRITDIIEPESISNLVTLAKGLLNDHRPDIKFDMAKFTQRGDDPWMTECGTVGCAVGHAPFYGIKKEPGESWYFYSFHKFFKMIFQSPASVDSIVRMKMWRWCFNGGWWQCDNSKEGAAKRIIYMLQYGLPENWKYNQNTVDLYDHITGFCPQWLKENGF